MQPVLAEEPKAFHWKVLPVLSPERQSMDSCASGNQGVPERDRVAFVEVTKIVTGEATDFISNGYADQRGKQALDDLVFRPTHAVPDLSDRNR